MLDVAVVSEVRSLTSLTPEQVVEQARSPTSALHPLFEWDDSEAASSFRLMQAKNVIKAVVRIGRNTPAKPKQVIVTVLDAPRTAPRPQMVVARTASTDVSVLRNISADLDMLQGRYRQHAIARTVFTAILAVVNRMLRDKCPN